MAVLVFTERLELADGLNPESPQMLCQALQSQVQPQLRLPTTGQTRKGERQPKRNLAPHCIQPWALPRKPLTSRCILGVRCRWLQGALQGRGKARGS